MAEQENLVIKQNFLFKKDFTGKGKQAPYNPFRVIELHDQQNLENVSFFVRDDVTISTVGISFRDRVVASLKMEFLYGKMVPVLHSLQKA
jgi:hypothetical protein